MDGQIKKRNQQKIDMLTSLKRANQKPYKRRNKPNTANRKGETHDMIRARNLLLGSIPQGANVLASKQNGVQSVFKKFSSKKCRREPKGRNSRDIRRRPWDNAGAGSKTRNTQEIQGNKRGLIKSTTSNERKALPHPKYPPLLVTKLGQRRGEQRLALGAGHCYMCAHAEQSSANIENMHCLTK